MHKLVVAIGASSYPIYIGSGSASFESILPHIVYSEVMIVSNPTVAQHYLAKLEKALLGKRCESVIIPDGEAFKTLDSMNIIIDALLKAKFSRQCTLIALGGGVVGDITGFAASCYQRGVDYIQVPTTLLAQVDSSVGGKTAVNHPLGKNMIGAFYQPKAVIIDVDTLATLPKREFAAGLAEVIKYGLIYDANFFAWLEQHADAIKSRDTAILSQMIERCCQIKADIVAQDERESHIRMILNFGHTFAHAIETTLGHGEILHGEAVAIGMVLATKLSEQLGLVHYHLVERLESWLNAMQLPIYIPQQCKIEPMLDAMERDKKKAGDSLRFIVLEDLGRALIKGDVPLSFVSDLIKTSY
ncbi:MAG: 3-dehydroquinate synthase [Gammaproteobacteria bacterium]|nr:3-dehydroquinate synthase [Gammaproteobacteria bacterium]